MCKNEKRTHGTAATGVPVAEMIARETRHTFARGRAGARPQRVQRPPSMPFPGRSIERVLRDLATPSNYRTCCAYDTCYIRTYHMYYVHNRTYCAYYTQYRRYCMYYKYYMYMVCIFFVISDMLYVYTYYTHVLCVF